MTDGRDAGEDWRDAVYAALRGGGVSVIGYVPDAGHARLIERARADDAVSDVVLTTEEEGVALAAGAWLGGARTALLMQSSGVGNIVNMASLREMGRFPMVILVTMRGEYAEFNPWQVPMGRNTAAALTLCGFHVERVERAEDAAETVAAAVDFAFAGDLGVAVLLSQKLIGRKKWTD